MYIIKKTEKSKRNDIKSKFVRSRKERELSSSFFCHWFKIKSLQNASFSVGFCWLKDTETSIGNFSIFNL